MNLSFKSVEARPVPPPDRLLSTEKISFSEKPIAVVILGVKAGRKRVRILIYPTSKGFQISPSLGGQLVVSRGGPDESKLLVEVDKAPQTIRAHHRAIVKYAKIGKRERVVIKEKP